MAKDKIHAVIRTAIQKEGWKITDDSFYIPIDTTTLAVDLGAERLIGAIQNENKIVIEIKTFTRQSLMYDFYAAFGQYIIYRDALMEQQKNRTLYLALSENKYNQLLTKPFLIRRIVQHNIKLIVVNLFSKQIVQWIEH